MRTWTLPRVLNILIACLQAQQTVGGCVFKSQLVLFLLLSGGENSSCLPQGRVLQWVCFSQRTGSCLPGAAPPAPPSCDSTCGFRFCGEYEIHRGWEKSVGNEIGYMGWTRIHKRFYLCIVLELMLVIWNRDFQITALVFALDEVGFLSLLSLKLLFKVSADFLLRYKNLWQIARVFWVMGGFVWLFSLTECSGFKADHY